MRPLLSLSRFIDRLSRGVGAIAAGLTLVMVLIAAANAVTRYAGRFGGAELSSNAWIEMQWYLFSLMFLLGSALTLRQDRHVRVDVLYGRLSPRLQAWIDFCGGLLLLLPFCGFAIWIAWPMVSESYSIREASPDPGGLPRWPIKASIVIAFVLLFLQGLSEIIKRGALLLGTSEEAVGLHEIGRSAPATDEGQST